MRKLGTLAAAALLTLGLAGCNAGERLLEEGVEQLAGDGEVDINEDGISVETSEGSFSANSDGELNIESDDGSFQSGADMPEGFPSVVPLPEGGQLLNGSRIEAEDGLAWAITYEFTSATPAEALEAQVGAMTDAGFTPPDGSETSFDVGDGEGNGLSGQLLQNGDYTVNVATLGEPGDFVLSLQVSEQREQ